MRRRIPLALTAIAVALYLGYPAPSAQSEPLPRKGYLGVRLAPERRGVLIDAVMPDTAAADGGIRKGDVLVAVDRRTVTGMADVTAAVTSMIVGQKFEVTLIRDGQRMVLPLTLKERPRDRGANFDVLYEHVISGDARIRIIVTRPHAPGRHPVLLLIQGLGPATIDQPLTGPEPYSRIMHEFARSAYVTVRVEKPGVGDSEGGPFFELDFRSELDAYRQAMMAVRQYTFVDGNKIFIFGHSMGGVFAPIIASEIPVRGLAVYGTVSKTMMEYFLENWRRQAVLGGDDPTRIDSMLRDLAAALHSLLIERKTPDDVIRVRPELRSTLTKLAPGGRIDGRSVSFWSQLASENVPGYWARGQAHVLAIWGRNDFIATAADHPLIAEIVNKARPNMGAYVALERIDHGFRETTSVEDSFRRWKSPGGDFNPLIITTLKEWMEEIRGRSQ
jgi:hypothetical protein